MFWLGLLVTIKVKELGGMVTGSVRSWGMHYVHKSPCKDRYTRMCVCVCVRYLFYRLECTLKEGAKVIDC